MEWILIFSVSALALGFAVYLGRDILRGPPDEPALQALGAKLRALGERFLRQQAGTVAAVAGLLGAAVFLSYGLLRKPEDATAISPLEVGVWLTASFVVGSAGALGVAVAATAAGVRASVRTAAAAKKSIDLALQTAVRGAAVPALALVAGGLVGMAALFCAVFAFKGGFGAQPAGALRLVPQIPILIAGFPLGATFTAFLLQLSGGSFAAAADIAADITGSEAGLVDDDAKNPLAMADLAGDLAGGVAGRSSAVFATSAAEHLAAMLIGAAVFQANPAIESALGVVLFPLVTRAFGLLASVFGVMVVRTDEQEDPLQAVSRGLYVSIVLYGVAVTGLAKWLLGASWLFFLGASAAGTAASIGLLLIARYTTEPRYAPVRELAELSRGGPTLTVLRGIAAGLDGAILSVVLIAIAAGAAYALGARSGLAGGGLFGLSMAAMGLFGTAAFVQAADGFSPVIDAAGGIVQMAMGRERPDVRGRTVVLDSVGTTVKAWAHVSAAATSALTVALLIPAYLGEANRRARDAAQVTSWRIDRPEALAAALIGVMLVAWVGARIVSNVVRAARRVADEARRQLRERPTSREPDHDACVEMLTRAALRQMITPSLVSAALPILVGVGLRFAKTGGYSARAADAVAAFLLAATTAGVLSSVLLAHAGGAWDNAKQYIATGAHGGRHLVDELGVRADNPTYAAALVGDTVGDAWKDAVCPAVHMLVKMLPVISLVFLPFIAG